MLTPVETASAAAEGVKETAEEVVDGWFKTIARQILEDEGLDPDRGAGFIDTTKIDEDKTKVS